MRNRNLIIHILVMTMAVLFIVDPISAGTRTCTSALVTANVCRSTSDIVYTLPISTIDPDTTGPRQSPSVLVADAFALLNNYQTPTSCTPDMVTATICTVGQIGALVPITKAQFADLQVRAFVLQTVLRYIAQQKRTEAEVSAAAEPTPDIGN